MDFRRRDDWFVYPLSRILALVSWLWRGLTEGPLRLFLAVSMGLLFGLLLLALRTSNAASYLSDDPKGCINCHIMAPYYAGWEHSRHRLVANCNDCHVPHDGLFRKFYFKAMDGLRHATVFTLRMEPQVLHLNEAAISVVQRNCVRCHEHQVMNTSMGADLDGRMCWDCHRTTPHGLAQSLSSTPNARRPALPDAGVSGNGRIPRGVPGRKGR